MQVLLVEPDSVLAGRIVSWFMAESLRIRWLVSGVEGEARVLEQPPDVTILSARLEDTDGLGLCRRLRETLPRLAVIVLAASAAEADRVAAFEAGADDVLPREPLSLRELALRVRAVVRTPRADPTPVEPPTAVGPFALDPESSEILLNGRTIDLSTLERGLLRVLLERPGRVVKRETLVERVWVDDRVEPRTVDTVVRRLRARLGEDGDQIETVRGVGYRLSVKR